MGRYRRTTVSGDVIEIEEFTRYETMDRCHRRGMSLGETEEGKAEYNRRQSVRKLARLINASDEHTELIHLRGNMARFGENARKALNSSYADKEMSLREIVSYCELCGLLRKEG